MYQDHSCREDLSCTYSFSNINSYSFIFQKLYSNFNGIGTLTPVRKITVKNTMFLRILTLEII